jgi:opacity protein-like surface antigen
MRKLLLFAVILLSFSVMAMAADEFPRMEVFGGYSYVRCDNTFFSVRDTSKPCNYDGFNLSVAANGTKWLGVEGSLSGAFDRASSSLAINSTDHPSFRHRQMFSFLFGPRVTVRSGKVTTFVHGLFGSSRVSPGMFFPYDNSFTMALGGGFDIAAYKNVSIRPVQIDYLTIKEGKPFTDNLRYSVGVVYRIGESSK